MIHRIGLVVNPIAGMGGRVGLKGTDGVVDRAVALGAQPSAGLKATEMLGALRARLDSAQGGPRIHWLTGSGALGSDCLADAGFDGVEVVYEASGEPDASDTRNTVQRFLDAGCELVVFCGGDGTARDVCSVTRRRVPILGVPCGVKMYSGVFGVSTSRTAEILFDFLQGELDLAEVEVLDIDEERFRRGEWAVRLYDSALTPYEPSLTQATKALIEEATDSEAKEEIAEDLEERLEAEPEALYLLGPGSTVAAIGRRIGIDKTLLGVDAVVDQQLIGRDLNEQAILALLDANPRCVLVLSPIGAQGFVLGRGNQQLSPEIVRRIGRDNLLIVATPAKLRRTPVLRFDSGEGSLDAVLARGGYLPVLTGYHLSRLVATEI